MSNSKVVVTVDSMPTHTPNTNTEKSVIYRLKNDVTTWVWDYNDNTWVELVQEPTEDFKEYIAKVLFSGTNAPVPTVYKNTFGAPIVWTFVGTGDYHATLASAFTSEAKTFVSMEFGFEGSNGFRDYGWDTVNRIELYTYNTSYVLANFNGYIDVHIRVYN
jgi:hypothetical protein